MSFEIRAETLDTLKSYYYEEDGPLDWPTLFCLPGWLKAWWGVFGAKSELYLRSVWKDNRIIGVAPLMRTGDLASLVGNANVCDYLDFAVAPGEERAFFSALLPRMREDGFSRLQLRAQRPESAVFTGLFAAGGEQNCFCSFCRENISYELKLPDSWEGYLVGLNKKQRHEVRRKLRRMGDQTTAFQYRVIESPDLIEAYLDDFLNMFVKHPAKADFLTAPLEKFFRSVIAETAQMSLCRFGLLEADGAQAAAVLYFDYGGRRYLYNSAFDPELKNISAGLVSKALCIQGSINEGCRIFDFLKGREVYKHRLGGSAIPIYRVDIGLKDPAQ